MKNIVSACIAKLSFMPIYLFLSCYHTKSFFLVLHGLEFAGCIILMLLWSNFLASFVQVTIRVVATTATFNALNYGGNNKNKQTKTCSSDLCRYYVATVILDSNRYLFSYNQFYELRLTNGWFHRLLQCCLEGWRYLNICKIDNYTIYIVQTQITLQK